MPGLESRKPSLRPPLNAVRDDTQSCFGSIAPSPTIRSSGNIVPFSSGISSFPFSPSSAAADG
jgi:hypothetical protein